MLSYYVENFYNEFFIFTERVKKYLETIKNKIADKKERDELKGLVNAYLEATNKYRDIRNEHNHKKRYIDENFRKLGLIGMTDALKIENMNLPKWDEHYKN